MRWRWAERGVAGGAGSLIALLNRDVTPVVPRWGSIGAGDLGLLAHIALVVIGRGWAEYDGTCSRAQTRCGRRDSRR
jgi:histidine ammonia-lyase